MGEEVRGQADGGGEILRPGRRADQQPHVRDRGEPALRPKWVQRGEAAIEAVGSAVERADFQELRSLIGKRKRSAGGAEGGVFRTVKGHD